MNPQAHTPQTIEWEYTNISPEKILFQLYSTIIKNGVHHVRLQQFAKIIDSKKGKLQVSDINTIRVQGLSLIALLYQYGYEKEAKLFLSIEWVEKNDIDIFIGKLLFAFWVGNITISQYIKDFLTNWDINAIPNIWTYPAWSILHFLLNVYLNHKEYNKYEILWLIEYLLWIQWFDINSLDTNWCTVLDILFYEPKDYNNHYIEDYFEKNWARYNSINWNKIRENIDKYRNKIQETITPTISIEAK